MPQDRYVSSCGVRIHAIRSHVFCAAWASVSALGHGSWGVQLGGAHMVHQYRSALALCYGLLSLLISMAPAVEFTPARVAVYFSPNSGATDAVVREVHAATQQILAQA